MSHRPLQPALWPFALACGVILCLASHIIAEDEPLPAAEEIAADDPFMPLMLQIREAEKAVDTAREKMLEPSRRQTEWEYKLQAGMSEAKGELDRIELKMWRLDIDVEIARARVDRLRQELKHKIVEHIENDAKREKEQAGKQATKKHPHAIAIPVIGPCSAVAHIDIAKVNTPKPTTVIEADQPGANVVISVGDTVVQSRRITLNGDGKAEPKCCEGDVQGFPAARFLSQLPYISRFYKKTGRCDESLAEMPGQMVGSFVLEETGGSRLATLSWSTPVENCASGLCPAKSATDQPKYRTHGAILIAGIEDELRNELVRLNRQVEEAAVNVKEKAARTAKISRKMKTPEGNSGEPEVLIDDEVEHCIAKLDLRHSQRVYNDLLKRQAHTVERLRKLAEEKTAAAKNAADQEPVHAQILREIPYISRLFKNTEPGGVAFLDGRVGKAERSDELPKQIQSWDDLVDKTGHAHVGDTKPCSGENCPQNAEPQEQEEDLLGIPPGYSRARDTSDRRPPLTARGHNLYIRRSKQNSAVPNSDEERERLYQHFYGPEGVQIARRINARESLKQPEESLRVEYFRHRNAQQETMQQAHHLSAAADELQKAGDRELAESLRKKAEQHKHQAAQLQRATHEKLKAWREHQAAASQPARVRAVQSTDELPDVIDDLRREIRELRAEMLELREELREVRNEGDDHLSRREERPAAADGAPQPANVKVFDKYLLQRVMADVQFPGDDHQYRLQSLQFHPELPEPAPTYEGAGRIPHFFVPFTR